MKLNRRHFLATASASLAATALGPASLAQSSLIRKAIPSSGERIPVVGLGTSRTFDVDPTGNLEAQRSVLARFARLGGTVIDTSPMYGNAEAVLGAIGPDLGVVDQSFYATKVWTDGGDQGQLQMAQSAKLMKTDVIDLMQVHNLRDLDTHLRTIRAMKERGEIRYVGVTHYRVDAYEALERVMRNEPLDFVQLNYSVATRDAEQRLLPLAQERGIAIMVNRAFEGGRLFGRVKGRPLPGIAKELGIESWGQYFLKFVLGHPAVTVVIPATAKVKHLNDNMAAAVGRLPSEAERLSMAQAIEV